MGATSTDARALVTAGSEIDYDLASFYDCYVSSGRPPPGRTVTRARVVKPPFPDGRGHRVMIVDAALPDGVEFSEAACGLSRASPCPLDDAMWRLRVIYDPALVRPRPAS